ncbi:MAG: hypothetical protein IPO38_16905 [Rhodocyclaceae bacterium]|nr:hypothetical protein [Rhodocyclaceae bacterium]
MKSLLFLVTLIASTSAFSWSRYDTYDRLTTQEQQQKLLELQRQLDQAEFQRQMEAVDRERAARDAADEAKREAEARARDAAEQAEQAAADLRNAMIRSSVRTRNRLFGRTVVTDGIFRYLHHQKGEGRRINERRSKIRRCHNDCVIPADIAGLDDFGGLEPSNVLSGKSAEQPASN